MHGIHSLSGRVVGQVRPKINQRPTDRKVQVNTEGAPRFCDAAAGSAPSVAPRGRSLSMHHHSTITPLIDLLMQEMALDGATQTRTNCGLVGLDREPAIE